MKLCYFLRKLYLLSILLTDVLGDLVRRMWGESEQVTHRDFVFAAVQTASGDSAHWGSTPRSKRSIVRKASALRLVPAAWAIVARSSAASRRRTVFPLIVVYRLCDDLI